MVTQTIKLLNISSIFGSDHKYSIQPSPLRLEADIIKKLDEIRVVFEEIEISRYEEINNFKSLFQGIVDNYKNEAGWNHVIWSFPPKLEASKHFGTPTTVAPLKYRVQSYLLKKLFFNNLLFFYYDFCYRMDLKFSEKIKICIEKVKKIKYEIFLLREVNKFSEEKLNLDKLERSIVKRFNIFNFIEELESIIEISWGLEKMEIREILYIDYDSNLPPYDQNNMFIVYLIIHNGLKVYITTMTDSKKRCLESQIEKLIPWIKIKNPLHIFEHKYLSYMTLNIEALYNRFASSSKDTRFFSFKNSINDMEGCGDCKKSCEDMLRNVCTVPHHRNLLEKYRSEYFANMTNRLLSNSILDCNEFYRQIYCIVCL